MRAPLSRRAVFGAGSRRTSNNRPAQVAAAPAVTSSYSPLAPGLALSNDLAWHVARRLAHAATFDLVAQIRAKGVNAWIREQVLDTAVDDTACDELVAHNFPWLTSTPAQLVNLSGDRPFVGSAHVARATAVRQLFTRRVVYESMVEFFGDLLYVSFVSDKCFGFTIDFDREVIRANALGKYRLMLRAGLKHPALLLFIDNASNVKDSVNENLGRELLELHTVGKTNGVGGLPNYSEEDVRQSSLLLTGHTRQWPKQIYHFAANRHHLGPVSIMGFTHTNASAKQGATALTAYADYLARHPATARRIATRLCIRFVSDTPPPALVERLSSTYLAQDTDIRPVLLQLFSSSEFRSSVGHKLRRPAEYTTAAIKAGRPVLRIPAGLTTTFPRAALAMAMDRLRDADHYPRGWPEVNGFPDVGDYWGSTQATMARIHAAYGIAEQNDPQLPCPAGWADTLGIHPGLTAHAAASALFVLLTGFAPSDGHRAALAAVLVAPDSAVPDQSTLLTEEHIDSNLTDAVALVLSSPYFALR